MAQLNSIKSRESIPWQFNCGYARVAVDELSAVKRSTSRNSVNKKLQAEKFQKLSPTVVLSWGPQNSGKSVLVPSLMHIVRLFWIVLGASGTLQQLKRSIGNHFPPLSGKLCQLMLKKKPFPFWVCVLCNRAFRLTENFPWLATFWTWYCSSSLFAIFLYLKGRWGFCHS